MHIGDEAVITGTLRCDDASSSSTPATCAFATISNANPASYIYNISSINGKINWKTKVNGKVAPQVEIDEFSGALYAVTSGQGKKTVVSVTAGKAAAVVDVSTSNGIVADGASYFCPQQELMYITFATTGGIDDSIAVVDVNSKQIVSTIHIQGAAPAAIAVDCANGTIYGVAVDQSSSEGNQVASWYILPQSVPLSPIIIYQTTLPGSGWNTFEADTLLGYEPSSNVLVASILVTQTQNATLWSLDLATGKGSLYPLDYYPAGITGVP